MTTTHRRLTAAAALLLAALALAHLAAPAHARSLQGKRKQSQAEREAQQLADQVVSVQRGGRSEARRVHGSDVVLRQRRSRPAPGPAV